MRYDYATLRRYLDKHGHPGDTTHGEGLLAEIDQGISVHDHPASGRPRELHFMVDGVKVAELGPVSHDHAYPTEDVEPGYVDLMAEWAGKPVRHGLAKALILHDNGLEVEDANAAEHAADEWLKANGPTPAYEAFIAGYMAAVDALNR